MRILEARLTVRDPAPLLAFYRDTLGFACEALHDGGFALIAGPSRLLFAPEARDASDAPAPFHHVAFNIPPDALDAARDWLAARVPLMPDEAGTTLFDFAAWEAKAIYFRDPAGNAMEFIARRRLVDRLGSTPFDASRLLSISEVGLPVHDVGSAVALCERELGLPFFSGDRETFSAVGDDHGLLIFSSVDRAWYPTKDLFARPFPTRLKLVGRQRAGAIEIPGGPYSIKASTASS